MNNTKSHAERELDILIKTTPDAIVRHFVPEIIALCKAFGNSGQSGGSAPFTASALSQVVKKLCLHKVIAPLTGEDDEWNDTGETLNKSEKNEMYQNNRQSDVFKDGKGGRAYYLDAIVWKGEEDWDTFTGSVEGIMSRQYIKSFPFKPKIFYIDVIRKELPEDWDEELYIEGKEWYDTKEFEKTGVKNWHKNKYRQLIKDRNQLKEVFEYYDEYKKEKD